MYCGLVRKFLFSFFCAIIGIMNWSYEEDCSDVDNR